jgi:LPXTG-motif cell wall-anchored protein
MSMRTARRLLAGVAAVGAIVASTALPAYAAPNIQLEARDALVAPDGYAQGDLAVYNDEEALTGTISVVIDAAGLKGAHLDWEGGTYDWLCDTESATLTRCEHAFPEDGDYGAYLSYTIRGESDANVGDEGTVAFTVETNGTTTKTKATVTIAEASDLSTGAEQPVVLTATGEPGGKATSNAPVSNVGKSTVEHTVLTIQPDYRTPYAGDFSNCVYYDNSFAICEFDQALEPGKNYRLSADIPYAIEKTARTGAVFSSYTDWWVEGDWKIIEKSWLEYVSDAVRGKGEPLRLEEVPSARRGAPQTDITPWDSGHELQITVGGDNQVDIAAIGAKATGAVGASVTVKPSITNLGPAALETMFEQPKKPAVRITIPEGTTVAEASWDCAPYAEGDAWPPASDDAWGTPGAREYGCTVWDLYPEWTYEYEFKLKIDKVVENAVGTLTAKIEGDPNATNDAAEIVVNGTGPDGGNGNGDGGSGGGEGGGLPVTGPQATLIAGVGVLLVAAGVGFVLFRRRRTRFVA